MARKYRLLLISVAGMWALVSAPAMARTIHFHVFAGYSLAHTPLPCAVMQVQILDPATEAQSGITDGNGMWEGGIFEIDDAVRVIEFQTEMLSPRYGAVRQWNFSLPDLPVVNITTGIGLAAAPNPFPLCQAEEMPFDL